MSKTNAYQKYLAAQKGATEIKKETPAVAVHKITEPTTETEPVAVEVEITETESLSFSTREYTETNEAPTNIRRNKKND